MDRYRVGIVGATGLVGQRLVQRLVDHPWFELVVVGASDRSAGRLYAEAVDWRLAGDPPAAAAGLRVSECGVRDLAGCDLVFSALDSSIARELEPKLACDGLAVVSNSSAFRQAEDVPLLIPEVNPDHLSLLERQRRRGGGGYIVTNPNCSATGLVLALAPLHRAFKVRRLVVATLQAVSGAGTQGPRVLDLLDNVLPYIPEEEEKMEAEVSKILGDPAHPAPIDVSAHCHRVPVLDGHLEAVSVELERRATPEQAREVLAAFRGEIGELRLPSACERPIVVRDEPDRPQPRLDRDTGGGMAVVVGRVRRCGVLGLKLEILSHNTIRGAAGGTLLNAEILAARDLLPRRGKP